MTQEQRDKLQMMAMDATNPELPIVQQEAIEAALEEIARLEKALGMASDRLEAASKDREKIFAMYKALLDICVGAIACRPIPPTIIKMEPSAP